MQQAEKLFSSSTICVAADVRRRILRNYQTLRLVTSAATDIMAIDIGYSNPSCSQCPISGVFNSIAIQITYYLQSMR